MIDIKLLRENPQKIKERLFKRGGNYFLDDLLKLDEEKRQLLVEIEGLRRKRNELSETIGDLQKAGNSAALSKKEVEDIRNSIREKEHFLLSLDNQIENILLRIPNIPDETVPDGKDSQSNRIEMESEIPQKNFEVLPHWVVGETLGILDFETAAKISGSRFAVLKNLGAKLERALIDFMLDVHVSRGYSEIFAPYLVNKKSVQGTGQLPKFESEVFKCSQDELYLIPTAEVSITNIHRDEIIPESEFPKKYVSYSACFRREAGSYGKDVKGLIRNHQFNKIELVKFVSPFKSTAEHETLLSDAQEVLKILQLPYRAVELCAGDLGFSAAKTYDLEIWMPGEKRWREVSSVSNFKDFQSRRLNIKMRDSEGKKLLVHTLNASGVAVGRTFAALLENYQNKDGSITIPEALRKYTRFDIIKP